MEEIKRAAGYIRVSTRDQVESKKDKSSKEKEEKDSLKIQIKKIKDHIKREEYELTEIYEDRGFSGGSTKNRLGLLRCMQDAEAGKFDVLVFNDLSRFGRNTIEILEQSKALKEFGVGVISIKERIDLTTPAGEAFFTMLAALAQLERAMIKERMLEVRIARAKEGHLPTGARPFGRIWNKEEKKFYLDEKKAKAIQWAADEYLAERISLSKLAEKITDRYGFDMSHTTLRRIFKESCGTKWIFNFEDEDPIEFEMPHILFDDKITALKERLEFNQTYNRTDVQKYVLTGFIRCDKCHRALYGAAPGGVLKYRHIKEDDRCKPRPFSEVNGRFLEDVIFHTLFENMVDVPKFEAAIKHNLPDENYEKVAKSEWKQLDKRLEEVENEKDKIIEKIGQGVISDDEAKNKLAVYRSTIEELTNETNKAYAKWTNIPDREKAIQDAEQIRKKLIKKYSGEQRVEKMSYKDKRNLLHWLFDGNDEKGEPYGIYVTRRGKWKNIVIDIYMRGRFRVTENIRIPGTVKDDELDYRRFVMYIDRPKDDPNAIEADESSLMPRKPKYKDPDKDYNYKTRNGSI